MQETPNSIIVVVIILTIVATLTSTFITLGRLHEIKGFAGITGMYSTVGTAYANLSVPCSVGIDIMDHGGPQINGSYIQLGTLSAGQNNNSDAADRWWIVDNDGTINVSLQVTATSQGQTGGFQGNAGIGAFTTGSTLGTGTCINANGQNYHRCLMVKCHNVSFNGSARLCNDSYIPMPNLSAGDPKNPWLVIELSSSQTDPNNLSRRFNEVWFGVNATVPAMGEPGGTKNLQVTIYAVLNQTGQTC